MFALCHGCKRSGIYAYPLHSPSQQQLNDSAPRRELSDFRTTPYIRNTTGLGGGGNISQNIYRKKMINDARHITERLRSWLDNAVMDIFQTTKPLLLIQCSQINGMGYITTPFSFSFPHNFLCVGQSFSLHAGQQYHVTWQPVHLNNRPIPPFFVKLIFLWLQCAQMRGLYIATEDNVSVQNLSVCDNLAASYM